MLVGPFTYVASQYYSPCTTDLPRSIFMYFSKWSFFIPRKNWTKNPLMIRKVLNWLLIMSSSDQFTAAKCGPWRNVSVPLLSFLAQVATKNRTLANFYGVLNSMFYLGCFLALWKQTLLFCDVAIDYFSSLQHRETVNIITQCIIVVMSIRIIVVNPQTAILKCCLT